MAASTSVVAATPAPAASPINPWAALSMMSSGPSAVAYCGSVAAASAASAAQPAAGCVLPVVDAAPPAPMISEPVPPPLPGAAAGVSAGFNPLYLLLGAAALGALAYFLLKGKNHSNSPS